MKIADHDGLRPKSGIKDADKVCAYCRGPATGPDTQDHKPDCVCVMRTVVVEMTLRFVHEVPASWDQKMIEFHLNDSSSCADNRLGTIVASTETGRCLCNRQHSTLVREATEEDHLALGYPPAYPSEDDPMAKAEQDNRGGDVSMFRLAREDWEEIELQKDDAPGRYFANPTELHEFQKKHPLALHLEEGLALTTFQPPAPGHKEAE